MIRILQRLPDLTCLSETDKDKIAIFNDENNEA